MVLIHNLSVSQRKRLAKAQPYNEEKVLSLSDSQFQCVLSVMRLVK